MEPSERNKRIIAIATGVFWFSIVGWVLLKSRPVGPFEFHWLRSGTTGERLPLIANIVLYGIAWAFFSMIPSAWVFLFALGVYSFLHRKDKRGLNRYYHPPYEEEMFYAGSLSFALVYITTGVLLLLHITNMVEIKFPGFD